MSLLTRKKEPRTSSLLLEISGAAEIQAELDVLASADGNLSVKGAISEAVRQGGVDKEADAVIAAIAADDYDGKTIRGAFTRLCMSVRNFDRTSILRENRMGSYLGDAGEAMARLGISRASLMLAVIRTLTVQEPHLWGSQDLPTAHAAAISKLKDELETAHQRIEQSITLGDLTVHQNIGSADRENGMSRITFRITGDTLHLGDGRDIGARLTNWWLANDGSKKRVA